MMVKETGYDKVLAACAEQSVEPSSHALYVSLGEQKLTHYHQGDLVAEYACRFGINPPSCIENSLGTPTGLHFVDEKYGEDAPAGMVFIGRVATGRCYWEYAPEETKNFVTSRILWLRGLVPGHNSGPGCDSHDRYIYIHGTNREATFETSHSHGCVQLLNADVIKLFDAVPSGTRVLIAD